MIPEHDNDHDEEEQERQSFLTDNRSNGHANPKSTGTHTPTPAASTTSFNYKWYILLSVVALAFLVLFRKLETLQQATQELLDQRDQNEKKFHVLDDDEFVDNESIMLEQDDHKPVLPKKNKPTKQEDSDGDSETTAITTETKTAQKDPAVIVPQETTTTSNAEEESTTTTVVTTTEAPTSSPTTAKPVIIEDTTQLPDGDSNIPEPTVIDDSRPEGYKRPVSERSDTYIKRGKPLGGLKMLSRLAGKWGQWGKLIGDKDKRPFSNIPNFRTSKYPNNDIPRTNFPKNAWQTDPEYLKDWLPEGIALAERAMEAILGEYGHSKYEDGDEGQKDFDERSFMFSLSIIERSPGGKPNYDSKMGGAGFATNTTLQYLRKRILHSIMTESTFTFVMGGHSAAAGHGNHFQQSYTLQVQRVLEPIFARLGVYHKSHNFAMGGLGTLQSSLGMRDVYGSNIDVLMWDSGMTERDGPSKDLYARKVLTSLDTVPVLWGDVDGGRYNDETVQAGSISTGAGMAGIPEMLTIDEAEKVPFAARYLRCKGDALQFCNQHRFNATCWIDRADNVTPPTRQASQPGGQAKWHPGNRVHQVSGRVIAFIIIKELYKGLKQWYQTPNYALPDEAWHVNADSERIREGVLAKKDTPCYQLNLPNRTCDISLRTRSEFTPRYNPAQTSIRSIMKEGMYVPQPSANIYDPPDERVPAFDAPSGEVDVLNILEVGSEFRPNKARREAQIENAIDPLRRHQLAEQEEGPRVKITSDLEPGQGWGLTAKSAADNCNGSWDSFCGRSAGNNCLLNGHNDNRGGLMFDSLSGWLIVNLEKIEHGIILIRIETWLRAGSNHQTEGWKCVNGATDCPQAKEDNDGRRVQHRRLGNDDNKCKDYKFEFAIDGKITSWTSTEFEDQKRNLQRVVQIWQLLDDAEFTGGKEKDVELAIRLTGSCAREITFHLSHIYWA